MEIKGIADYFEKDHDRLDGLFCDFQDLKRKDPGQAKARFKEFRKGLMRHIIWEEDILFPIFEEKSGMTSGGPTAVMREEHLRIKNRLEALHDRVRLGDPESEREEFALLEILKAHNIKEEEILYPAIDNLLDAEGLSRIWREMSAVSPARYERCCENTAQA